ncbi:tetratricopeptide repeat protein [Fundidesulfovibrio soli]|uniref:tetratricopeptide repeat protein n=1 Tax=Fundidesulfovibrio soli TaxID=2922716 RepID=UPI001FAEBC43|nr:tetratricopeptide repeat protein [Fundidesulfovibrio soli]
MGLVVLALLGGCNQAGKQPPATREADSMRVDDPEKIVQQTTMHLSGSQQSAADYQLRGQAYFQLYQYDLAYKDFEQVTQRNSRSATAWFNLGTAAFKLNKEDRAVDYFTQAISLDGSMLKAYNNRGLAYLSLGQNEKALNDFNMALRLSENRNFEALFNRAIAYQRTKDFDRALADYDKLLSMQMDFAPALANKAEIYWTIKRFPEARKALDLAVKSSPRDPDLYFNRAIILEQLNDVQGALQDYGQALSLKSNFAAAYYNRGLLLMRTNNPNKGCEDLSVACMLGLCERYDETKKLGLCN